MIFPATERGGDPIGKTIFASPAGKKLLSKKLVALFPTHKTYVEPFAGSAAVLFRKEASETEVINDLDPGIANAFKAIKSLTADEIDELRKMDWVGSKATYLATKDSAPETKLGKLHKFLYTSHFAFGHFRGKSGFNRHYEGKTATAVDRVAKHQPRLKSVKVLNKDYREVVKDHDSADTLFFLDPPYPGYDALNSTDQGFGTKVGEKHFDEDAFFEVLKTIKGKFVLTYGTKGRTDFEGFHVKKLRSFRFMSTRGGGDGAKVLNQLIVSNFELPKDAAKSLKDDDGNAIVIEPFVKGLPSGDAESGIHVHTLERENGRTKTDGAHSHLFMLSTGEVLITDEDGEHEHAFHTGGPTESHDSIGWDGEHFHRIELADGSFVETEFSSSGHTHETQLASTAFDGLHQHKLKLPGGAVASSMTPADFYNAIGRPNQAGNPAAPPASVLAKHAGEVLGALESFKLRSSVVRYSDGNLYVAGGPDIRKAVESAVGRMLPAEVAQSVRVLEGDPPGDYAEVADLVVSIRPEFVAKANAGGTFSDEDGVPGVLTWKAIASGAMPPDGESALPEKLEVLVPERFRYWKQEGSAARGLRDALYDSGFFSPESIRIIDGEARLVTVKHSILEPEHIDQFAKPAESSFASEVAELTGKVCVLWTEKNFPEGIEFNEEHASSVLVFDPSVTGEWLKNQSARAVVKQLASLDCKFLFGCPDSVGVRHAFGKAFEPFIVKRSACAGVLFATNLDIASSHVEVVGNGSVEFERQRDFILAKQEWDGHTLWHLTVGDDRWILQGDPLGGGEVTAIRGTTKADTETETIDTGRAVYVEESVDVKKLRFDGGELEGVCEFTRVADPVWSFRAEIEDSQAEVTKRFDVREFVIKADEERFVFGIVLEPDGVDAQDDTISGDEIRTTAHKYMEQFQNIGLMHKEIAEGVRILESYLAPVEFTVGERTVKKGTWLLAVRVLSDKIWKSIKDGSFTGFSIGGSAIRTPT